MHGRRPHPHRHARLRPGITSLLGDSATSRPPLAAVAATLVMAGLTGHLAASGTVDNINDSLLAMGSPVGTGDDVEEDRG